MPVSEKVFGCSSHRASNGTDNARIKILVDHLLEKRHTLEFLRKAETLGEYVRPLLDWTFQPSLFPYAAKFLELITKEIETCFDPTTAKEAERQLRQNFSVETGMHVSLPRTLDRATVHSSPASNINTLVIQSSLLSAAAHLSAEHKLHISCLTGRIFLSCATSSAAYFQPEPDHLIRLQSNKWDKTPQCYLPPLTLEAFDKALGKTSLTEAGERRANIMRQAIGKHADSFSRQIVTAHAALYNEFLPPSIRQVAVDYELFAPAFLIALLEDKNSITHQLFATEEGRAFLLNEFSDVSTAWGKEETPFDVLELKDGRIRQAPYHGDLSPETLCAGLKAQKLMPKTALNFLVFLLEAGLAPTGGMQQTLYATQLKTCLHNWLKLNRPNDQRIDAFAAIPTDRAILSPLWGVKAKDRGTPIGYNEALNGWRLDKETARRILRVRGETALSAGAILMNNFVCPDTPIDDTTKHELLQILAEQGDLLQVE